MVGGIWLANYCHLKEVQEVYQMGWAEPTNPATPLNGILTHIFFARQNISSTYMYYAYMHLYRN